MKWKSDLASLTVRRWVTKYSSLTEKIRLSGTPELICEISLAHNQSSTVFEFVEIPKFPFHLPQEVAVRAYLNPGIDAIPGIFEVAYLLVVCLFFSTD